jgi:hypothetical protein
VGERAVSWASPKFRHDSSIIYWLNFVNYYLRNLKELQILEVSYSGCGETKRVFTQALLVREPFFCYNYNMVCRKIIFFCIFPLLISACESVKPKSRIPKPQSSQWYYTYTVLLTPEHPANSPKMEIALSMFQMRSPPAQAAFVNHVLYAGADADVYKDRVVREQRDNYRKSLSYLADIDSENLKIFDLDGVEIKDLETSNWHYTENFIPISPRYSGIVIERTKETYTGGAHEMLTKRYYVLDLEAQKLLKIDDFLSDYQGDRMRNIIYDELKKFTGLKSSQSLSEGIFLNDEPELTFNFYINEAGLGLHWDPYEIAPYSEGAIQIILPWKKIRPMMLDSGMELLVKFNINLFE